MLTADVTVGQLPLVTLQRNTLVPVPNALMAEEGLLIDKTVPDPESSDQLPIPTPGFTAARVAVAVQSV